MLKGNVKESPHRPINGSQQLDILESPWIIDARLLQKVLVHKYPEGLNSISIDHPNYIIGLTIPDSDCCMDKTPASSVGSGGGFC